MNDQEMSKRSEKRRELFKLQQQAMLQGYNQNSFKTSKPRKQQIKSESITIKEQGRDQTKSMLEHNQKQLQEIKDESARKQTQTSRQQQEFDQILDQMSLNSSSKLQSKSKDLGSIKIIPKPRKSSRKYESSRHQSNLNISKSHTGLLKAEDIEINAKNGNSTLKSSQNALNSLIETQHQIELEINDELNRKQFAEENPYGGGKLNMTDYQSRNLKEASGKEQKRRRSFKQSPFEKYEEIRFECYELKEKINTMNELMQSLVAKMTNKESKTINLANQTIEVPFTIVETLAKFSGQIVGDFDKIQSKWSENFDEQQQSHTRQRSKNKKIKRKLKDLENKSAAHASLEREFEHSMQQIRDAHDHHTNQMGVQLDQIEHHVNNLRDTRLYLNSNYEQQLDKAVKEMVNFYENIGVNDVDSDNMSIEQVFFIKPSHHISQTIQKRSKSHLKLSHNAFSTDNSAPYNIKSAPRAYSSGPQQRTPNIVPKLQIERIYEQMIPEPPRIINIVNNNSYRSGQNQNTNEPLGVNVQSAPKTKESHRNNCPSGRQSNRMNQVVHIQSARAQPISSRRGSNYKSRKSSHKGECDYVTNPVIVGAMQMTSKFDNRYEDDFEEANVTLDMKTERLKQFPQDYNAINSIANQDERILMKQVVFMKYEKILKKQAKIERKIKKKALKQQKEALEKEKKERSTSKKGLVGELQFKPKSQVPTPTHKSSYAFGKMQHQQSSKGSLRGGNNQQLSSNSSAKNVPKGLGMNERHEYHENSQLTSRFSLHSELPPLDTQDVIIAQQRFIAQDVNRTELIECEEDLALGMKTATQTSLIKHYEEEFRNKDHMRQQLKNDEKKLDYNSTFQSKTSCNVKQMSIGSRQQDIIKHYASNQSGQNPHHQESEDYSIASGDIQHKQKSNKKEMKDHQFSIKGKNQKILAAGPNYNNQSFNLDSESFEQKGSFDDENKRIMLNYESRRDDLMKPPIDILNNSLTDSERIKRFEEYHESPIAPAQKTTNNSYLTSEGNTPSRVENSNIEDFQHQVDLQKYEIQTKKYEQFGNEIRQKLPLDIIHERQSEFSQSMITSNAKGVNTHRSKNPNGQYTNLPQNATVQKNNQSSFNFALLSNRQSDCNVQSSANRKNSSRGALQESFDDHSKMMLIRSNSVAQTHRNSEHSFINNPAVNNSLPDHIIEGNFSRNIIKKNSSSSKENTKKENLQMKRQPSAGHFERESKSSFFNIEPFAKNKNLHQPMLPSRRVQCSEKKIINTRNNHIQTVQQNTVQQNYTTEKEQFTSRQGGQHFNQQLSYRSYHNPGGESYRELRDRSYFDESPAVFEPTTDDKEAVNTTKASRIKQEEKIKAIQSNVDNSVQSQLVSMQVYQTESVDSSQHQKFGTSIKTNQILNSIPQSIGPSSVKAADSKSSKHQRSKESGKENNSLNQVDSHHHNSGNQSHKELILNSSGVPLKKIEEHGEFDIDEEPPNKSLIRSNSYVQIRDKEFLDLCLDDEDVAIAEQNFYDVFQLKLLNQSKQNGTHMHNQSTGSAAQMLTSNILLNKFTQKTCTEMQIAGQTPSIIDQNSSQQQTRGQRTFAKFLNPNRPSIYPLNQYCLGTNFLTNSLDIGTMHLFNNLMNPRLYRKTLLMMANLHNNYLHSINSGTLFTMQRGWNSGYCEKTNLNPQLTNHVRFRKEFLQNNQSTTGFSGMIRGLQAINEKQTIKGDQALKSLGGEPVNIANLLLGAKQQTTDRINVGSITIVEEKDKSLLDRKLFVDVNNSAKQQTKGRKLFNQSRNQQSGQGQISTQEGLNMQTKQMNIFNQRNSQQQNSNQHFKFYNEVNDYSTSEMNNKDTPNQVRELYGGMNDSAITNDASLINESKKTIKPTQYLDNQSNKIQNLLVGLKHIQMKASHNNGGNQSQRSGSDLSINSREVKSSLNNNINQETVKKIIKLQQPKGMNMSTILSASNLSIDQQHEALKSKSVPKGIKKTSIANVSMQSQINVAHSGNIAVNKEKVKVILTEGTKKNQKPKKSLQLLGNDESTLKNFHTITAEHNNNQASLQKLYQSNNELSSRGKQSQTALKNVRTNSSCLPTKSNVTTISSGRGSSGGNKSQPDNLYMDQNGKIFVKKKLNVHQVYKTGSSQSQMHLIN